MCVLFCYLFYQKFRKINSKILLDLSENMEYQYYNDFYNQKINTGDLWRAVKQCEENFQHSDLVAFREKLQLLLFDYKKITAEFHAITWRYHRDKYKHFSDSKWFDEIYNYVFEPDFFMEKSNNTSLNGLTDEHKLMIVVPEKIPYDDLSKNCNIELTENQKQDILEKLNKGKRYVNTEDDADPYNWWRWSYDIYTLYQDFEVNIEENPDEFEYFFAWRLAVTDLYKIKEFLAWHLENTFQNRVDDFKEYIEIMYLKNKQILINENTKALVFSNLQKVSIESNPVFATSTSDNETSKTKTKNAKEKLEIPITMVRKNTDTYTILNANDTVILFEYLSEAEAILCQSKHYDYLKKTDKAKAIQVLSGFSHSSLTDHIEKNTRGKDKRAIRNVKKVIDKINYLIQKDLA